MRKNLFVIAIVLSLIVIAKWRSRSGREEREAQTIESEPKKMPQRSARVLPTSNPTALPTAPPPHANLKAPEKVGPENRSAMIVRQLPAPPDPTKRRQPPPHAVPYHLEDGLLIAYGDIILGQPTSGDTPGSGYAEAPELQLWPSTEIPYFISPKLENPERVNRVLAYFNQNTPIRFVPFNGQKDALVFEPAANHCRSYLGRIGGHQPLFIASGCHEPEISHEVMHALGSIHEQSRPDRDQYVKINWDKIEEDKASQFEVVPDQLTLASRNRPFDYRSIMLYAPSSFARNAGEITIESTSGARIDPVQEGLSHEDLERLNLLYGR